MKAVATFTLILFSTFLMAQNTFIAHRGASHLAPENTIASANLAWELGANAVEIDIQLSKNNRIIVIHDYDTKRITNDEKNLVIAETSSSALRKIDAGIWKDEKFKGEKLPFLSEIIETIPTGKKLVVEIKCGPEVLPKLKKCIKKSGKQDQIIFIAFGWETILKTAEEFPDNKCYWLSSKKEGLNEKMEIAAEKGLSGVDLQYSVIDENVMANAKKLGLEVLSWTVDDPVEARRLTDIGVSGITTNRPKWLQEEMNK